MKYLINFDESFNTEKRFNAASKAKMDVLKTFNNEDRKIFYVKARSYSLFGRKIYRLTLLMIVFTSVFLAIKIKKNDEVYFQYPFGHWSFDRIINIFLRLNIRINLIIHDIESFRKDILPEQRTEEIERLNKMDTLYVHTPAMKNLLEKNGVSTKMKCIYLFDYYSDDPMLSIDELKTKKNTVAFAGNLNKSEFLVDFNLINFYNITINLYGLIKDENVFSNEHFKYCGKFSPNKTGIVKAGWGLVWDGPSITNCEGVYGDYLRYNSSHKISLYLACGMPLILWSQSSLAQWASKKGVCIIVNSLTEIEEAINKLTEKDYEKILVNTRKVGEDLRKGNYLLSAINS